MMKFVARCKEGIAKIVAIEDTPHAVALGTSIGVLFGITPLFGIKMPLAVALSFIARANIVATLAIVSLADLFTPFLAVVYFAEYKIGCYLFALSAHAPSMDLIDENCMMPHWIAFLQKGLPLLAGSLIVGTVVAVPVYGIIKGLLNKKCSKNKHE